MLFVMIFDAKEGTTLEEINRERQEWFGMGRDKALTAMCGSIERYEVTGMSPLRIFFVIETDDPNALNVLSHHFGDYWDSVAYPIIRRGIFDAMEEDRTVTCG